MGKGELWRIRESGHALVPVRAGEHDAVPLRMDVGRSVTQVGDSSLQDPRAAAIKLRGVAAIAVERLVEFFSFLDSRRAGSLGRGFWNRRHNVRRRGEGNVAV